MTLSETLVEETGTQAPLVRPRTGPAPPPHPFLGEYRTSKSAAMVPGANSAKAAAMVERALMKSIVTMYWLSKIQLASCKAQCNVFVKLPSSGRKAVRFIPLDGLPDVGKLYCGTQNHFPC